MLVIYLDWLQHTYENFPQTVWWIETQFDRIHTLILTSKSTDIKSGLPLRISFPIYRMKAEGRETTSDEHFLLDWGYCAENADTWVIEEIVKYSRYISLHGEGDGDHSHQETTREKMNSPISGLVLKWTVQRDMRRNYCVGRLEGSTPSSLACGGVKRIFDHVSLINSQ